MKIVGLSFFTVKLLLYGYKKAEFRLILEAEILKSFFQGLFLQGQYICWPDKIDALL